MTLGLNLLEWIKIAFVTELEKNVWEMIIALH